ncbi:MAG: tol-pal system protein YbgF [Deltaproteobacteria bacterium]|nr:tol-pal system protein YbgF [Deltaproteobacteria bacterium]
MKDLEKGLKSQLLLSFFGLAFALSGCAMLQPAGSVGNLEERIARLEEGLKEISAQVEKNRDNLLFQEAKIRDHQALLEGSGTEKGTAEAANAAFDPAGVIGGRDITPATVYRAAFGNYASGRYQPAVLGFRAFLERYPDNPYAANAQFWLGECHYALDEYPQALEAFDALVNFQPPSDKAPDALLRIVAILKKLPDENRAQETARFLLKNYPDSPAARTLREYYPEYKAP